MGISNPVLPSARITNGTFTGTGQNDHAIAHGLGSVPKRVDVWRETASYNADFWTITDKDSDALGSRVAATFSAVTAMDSTNFTTGKTGVHESGNTTGVGYQWIAWA